MILSSLGGGSVLGGSNQELKKMQEGQLVSFVHTKIIHQLLDISPKIDRELHDSLQLKVELFISDKVQKAQDWQMGKIALYIRSKINKSEKYSIPPQEFIELVAFLAPFHKQILAAAGPNSLYLKCVQPTTLRAIPQPTEHIIPKEIGSEEWLQELKNSGLEQHCLDIRCGGACDLNYAFQETEIETEGTAKPPAENQPISNLTEPEPSDNESLPSDGCGCGLDHSPDIPVQADPETTKEKNSPEVPIPLSERRSISNTNQPPSKEIQMPGQHSRVSEHLGHQFSRGAMQGWRIFSGFTLVSLAALIINEIIKKKPKEESLASPN